MKIAINCRTLNKRHGGPKRYLYNLLKEFSKLDKKNEYLLLLDKDYDFNFDLPKNFKKKIFNTKSRILFEYYLLPKYVKKEGFDVYFVPDPVFSLGIKAKKIITVYHDIIYFEKNHKREFKFWDNLHHKFMIKLCKNYSDINICVSRTTAKRAKELLNLRNIRIIHEGIENHFRVINDYNRLNKTIKKYKLDKPFIFYIGSLSPRKNIKELINAFSLIKNKFPHNLYLFGAYSWLDKDVNLLIKNKNIKKRVVKKGFINEEDLPSVYNLASAFVYPSLYEGFGLPILEAQACGCPTITSNFGAMKEIAGKGALIINPRNREDLAKGISRVISDQELKESLVNKGISNVNKYSWYKCAKEVLKIFNEVN